MVKLSHVFSDISEWILSPFKNFSRYLSRESKIDLLERHPIALESFSTFKREMNEKIHNDGEPVELLLNERDYRAYIAVVFLPEMEKHHPKTLAKMLNEV